MQPSVLTYALNIRIALYMVTIMRKRYQAYVTIFD